MKANYFTQKTDSFRGGLSVSLLIFVFASSAFSQNLSSKAEFIPHARENHFRSAEDTGQATAQKLYSMYGNDFDGPSDFYLAFNLQNRQTVGYEIVDITGRTSGLGEIPDVLDQTYKVTIQVESAGIYIVRLIIDSRYYVEKIYFK